MDHLIYDDEQLKDLDFIRTLNIQSLELVNCDNIVPKLQSSTIRQLQLINCNRLISVHSLQNYDLSNLEILTFCADKMGQTDQNLVSQILKYQKLSQLILIGQKINVNPLSQMVQLTYLSINDCGLCNIDALKSLSNLEELSLDWNNGVDITSLQHLTQLIILQLNYCNLISVDALRPLNKLKYLSIIKNSVVYIQPLLELNKLSALDARYNKIQDILSIQNHPSFQLFKIDFQEQPQQQLLKLAKMMMEINRPIVLQKQMNKLSRSLVLKHNILQQKIVEFLQKQYGDHVLLSTRVSLLLNIMNALEDCQ
ncbi:leucine-rich_repeat domain-containing protein [Hexamita inflata]|uniref:Leucine-rich repeat domain-containing protein n=1 Tax=Hexamita inflata TaxID=28002 RepID=A0AA86TB41_9EUKA|nr:leucine-rich repeat domain-containing protein [Hexamita inflata]